MIWHRPSKSIPNQGSISQAFQINRPLIFKMPILSHNTGPQHNQSAAFNESVSSVPMAMSMMVDSLVNMMQSNLPNTQHDIQVDQLGPPSR